jgi:hypothetical protein
MALTRSYARPEPPGPDLQRRADGAVLCRWPLSGAAFWILPLEPEFGDDPTRHRGPRAAIILERRLVGWSGLTWRDLDSPSGLEQGDVLSICASADHIIDPLRPSDPGEAFPFDERNRKLLVRCASPRFVEWIEQASGRLWRVLPPVEELPGPVVVASWSHGVGYIDDRFWIRAFEHPPADVERLIAGWKIRASTLDHVLGGRAICRARPWMSNSAPDCSPSALRQFGAEVTPTFTAWLQQHSRDAWLKQQARKQLQTAGA